MKDRIDITCPCCNTRLTVDVETSEILGEERPKPDHAKTFDQALGEVRSGSRKREDAFSKAFDKTQRLDDLLSKKFDEAKKKASKDTSKPRNPFDLD